MQMTLKEIADHVGGELEGDGNIVISGVNGIKEAGPGDVTFVANSRFLPLLDETDAAAVLVDKSVTNSRKAIVRCDNPYVSFIGLMSIWETETVHHPQGIHPTALIGENVLLGSNVAVGAYAVIEHDSTVGDNAIIYPQSYIGNSSSVGANTIIYPNVTIRSGVRIGDRVIIHSGTCIGADGFGFAPMKGVHHKVPQIGTVIIEDDVEIGANVTVDRATFHATVVGKGTKIDNLVQIAHNVTTGENCIIVSQTGISGSTKLGNNVRIGGQVGIIGHITIGDDVAIAARSGVSKSCEPRTFYFGAPAQPHVRAKKIQAATRRLPEMLKRLRVLEQQIEEIRKQLDE